jgi:hypothetical protein
VLSLHAEEEEDDSSAASFAASDGEAHDKSSGRQLRNSTNARPANQRNPSVPRRKNRLTVDLEVWGHYPPQLNVDFDVIVQDSINRETQVIREELKEYNSNCDDQTEKVDDHGYLLGDFEEIYSNKGVMNQKRRGKAKDLEEEEDMDSELVNNSEEGGVFRTACSNAVKLPEYFEASLEEIKATSATAVILEEESGTPIMVIGLLSALLVIMLVGGFLVFRMGEFDL